MPNEIEADVLIIGGGVAGASLARELSKYDVETVLIEKECDVSMGISKTGSGYIYFGLEMASSMAMKGRTGLTQGTPEYETIYHHIRLALQAYPNAHQLIHDLNVGHKHRGCIIIGRNEKEIEQLKEIEKIARQLPGAVSTNVRFIDRDSLIEIEPSITRDAIGAVYDPESIVDIFPPEYVIALAENARENGVKILLGTEALAFSSSNGDQIVETNRGSIHTKFIINAAGKYVDKVAQMAGARDEWGAYFGRAQSILLDKRCGELVNNHIRVPTTDDMVVSSISPLHDGNVKLFFNVVRPTNDRENRATEKESFDLAFRLCKKIVPSLSEKDVITSWASISMGRHAESVLDNMEVSKNNPGFINLVPMMPSLAASPLVAEGTVELLGNQGLKLINKASFKPYRQGIPKFRELSDDAQDKLICQDSRYGHVVCRCETVTEGEIVEAIKRGATTVQGIQFRTRAAMGRCQSGFCGPKLVKIMSRELGIPATEVTKMGGDSRILLYRSKELVKGPSL